MKPKRNIARPREYTHANETRTDALDVKRVDNGGVVIIEEFDRSTGIARRHPPTSGLGRSDD
jgi:hypothetical protein